MKNEKNVMVVMRDGVKLATDLSFPQSEKETTFQDLVYRTLYNKDYVEN